MMFRLLIGMFLFGFTNVLMASNLVFSPVSKGVYVYVGPTSDRTPENLGLNNNIGLIETQDGWVLIDSGSGSFSAKLLYEAVQQIKARPIIAVINIGSQDHRWLGNDFFAQKGAKIYAYEKTVQTQKSMFAQLQLSIERKVPALKGTKIKTADVVLSKTQNWLSIGGVKMLLMYYGDAHFPGDTVLWLPEIQVLFTGDVVYVDRMLGIHPWSNPVTWLETYRQMRTLPAKIIVPGHGKVTDWKQADVETGDYLHKLVETMAEEVENFSGVGQAVKVNQNWPEFKHLKHYDSWHKRNLNRTYLQIESGL